jgi:signal transduction histidine kinase
MEAVYFQVQVLIFLFNLTLGYVVWTYNSKSNLNRILTLIIACILLLDISLLFYLKMEGRRLLFATIILGSLGISFFAPLFYTLSLYYPVRRSIKRKYPITIYTVSLALSILMVLTFPKDYLLDKSLFPNIFVDFSLKKLPLAFVLLYFLVTCFSVGMLILATRNFHLSSKEKAIPYERNTIRMLTWVGMPMAFGLTTVDVINFFFSIPFQWISFLYFAFTSFIVVLVLRFHIVDLRRFINGILLYPALFAVLVFLYLYVLWKQQDRIAEILMIPSSVALVMEVFIIYLVVSTLRRVVDISFLRRKFPNIALLGTGNIESLKYLSYAVTIKDLNKRLKEVFRKYNKTENMMMLLHDNEKNEYAGIEKGSKLKIKDSSELVKVLSELSRGVTLEELLMHVNDREDIELLHRYDVNLILPIERGEETIALILLPRRSVIHRWSYEDVCSLNYLKLIIPPLIDRCMMYENEKEIEKHQYRMEQYMVIGQMASGIAHEIRNPLSIISTSVETILKNEIKEGDRTRMLQYIQEESERINLLANKLLNINYQKNPEVESVDLTSVFHRLRAFLEYKLKDKNITFFLENEEPCTLFSDQNLIFQIFLNLALNSIEAIKEDGRIDVSFIRDHNAIKVVMKDSGSGIPEELRKRIYEPFFTTRENGTGLGLTVTKTLVENLYGYIKLVPSTKGTSFEIYLPSLKLKE